MNANPPELKGETQEPKCPQSVVCVRFWNICWFHPTSEGDLVRAGRRETGQDRGAIGRVLPDIPGIVDAPVRIRCPSRHFFPNRGEAAVWEKVVRRVPDSNRRDSL